MSASSPAEIEVSGDYDLEALFVRLNYAIDRIGAKRVVLDTIEALFSGLTDQAVLRAELRRLFGWLKDKGVTAIITAERGEGQLTRYGIEEYVSDCVILLDNRVFDQVSTRRLRIVKYRGSAHGTNEYPFLIDDRGISVMPITSAGLEHQTSAETVPTGIADLDAMFGIGGFFRGSSVLISGLAGTGKSTFSASFANSMCQRGEKCLYFAFEESPAQIIRNMRSAGIHLQPHVDAGLLHFEAARPSLFGLEMHLARMNRDIEEFAPSAVIIDPISAFRGVQSEIHATLLRLIDVCKGRGITAVLTSLSLAADHVTESDRSVSSLMDSWISLTDVEANGERNRVLYLLKSRGMAHSNQIREYLLTGQGIQLIEPYIGQSGVLTGTARLAQEGLERADERERQQVQDQRRRVLARKRQAVERQIAELQAALEAEEEEADLGFVQDDEREGFFRTNRTAMAAQTWSRPMSEDAAPEDIAIPGHYNLRLYVAGQTPKSLSAIANLKSICEEHLAGRYTVEVIDLLENPQLAAGDQILAVPTLVRHLPPPIKRVIGSLSDTERVLVGLNIVPLQETGS